MQTLPSGHDSGLVLAPFRGVRYDPDRVSGLANVTSPPYDVIGSGTLDHLLAAEPHNIVRLILPGLSPDEALPGAPAVADPAEQADPAARAPDAAADALAARRLGDWLASGVLASDPEPALYVYEQSGPGWLQRGLIGLVGVGSPDSAGILPHEGVMPGPVTGRRRLMMATRANLEPIFLVYNGGGGGEDSPAHLAGAAPGSGGHGGLAGPDSQPRTGLPSRAGLPGERPRRPGERARRPGERARRPGERPRRPGERPGPSGGPAPLGPFGPFGMTASGLVRLAAEQRPPLVSTVTDDGITHRLWRLTDPAEHAAVAADLAGRTALIADGHHRYAAYRELRDLMHGAGRGAGPWDYGLAFLVDADSHPPRLGAIHRVIPHLAPDEAARLAAEAFTVEDIAGGEALSHGALSHGALSHGALSHGALSHDGVMAEAMRRLAEAGQNGAAFLLAGRSGFRLLTQPDHRQIEAAMPPSASAGWRALDASVMQELLLARLWSIKDNERDVLISHDAREAVSMALDAAGTAVICNPVPFAAVKQVAEHGERVPRKSTSFGPKPRTGLVLRTWGQ